MAIDTEFVGNRVVRVAVVGHDVQADKVEEIKGIHVENHLLVIRVLVDLQ